MCRFGKYYSAKTIISLCLSIFMLHLLCFCFSTALAVDFFLFYQQSPISPKLSLFFSLVVSTCVTIPYLSRHFSSQIDLLSGDFSLLVCHAYQHHIQNILLTCDFFLKTFHIYTEWKEIRERDTIERTSHTKWPVDLFLLTTTTSIAQRYFIICFAVLCLYVLPNMWSNAYSYNSLI